MFCRFGIQCKRHQEGNCQFNHDPNHPKWKTHPLNPNRAETKKNPSPPEQKWDFNKCKRHGVCVQWMRSGTCTVENCRFNHEIAQEAEEPNPLCHTVKVGAVKTWNTKVSVPPRKQRKEVVKEQIVVDKNLVLLDSGSDEVVRPFNGWEWQQIVNGEPHTRRVKVGLALDQTMDAGITVGGELMRAPPMSGSRSIPECGWICPITRIRKELGMDFYWTARGPVISGGKMKGSITGVEIDGLAYCTWDQFQDIRWALQQSHRMGRKPAKVFCGIHGDDQKAQQGDRSEDTLSNIRRVPSNLQKATKTQKCQGSKL